MKPEFRKRIDAVLSDPHNDLIPRVPNAGELIDNQIVMHNGLKVYADSHYPALFTPMLCENKGCHEPQEEYWFQQILPLIPSNGTMIEVGAYWSFYSMWFLKDQPERHAILIEPDENRLTHGRKNVRLNQLQKQAYFIHGKSPEVQLTEILKQNTLHTIDLLHAVIQGAEYEMLLSEPEFFKNNVRYIFISTHGQEIHVNCRNLLKEYGCKFFADVPPYLSLCHDGILVGVFSGKSSLSGHHQHND